MATEKNATTKLTITLPDSLVRQLELMATGPDYHSKSEVIEAAVRAILAGTIQQNAVDEIHRRLDSFEQSLMEALQHVHRVAEQRREAATDATASLTLTMQVRELVRGHKTIDANIKTIHDLLTGRLIPPKPTLLARLWDAIRPASPPRVPRSEAGPQGDTFLRENTTM